MTTLAAAGVLFTLGATPAFPQVAGSLLPAGTVPQLRGVVSGQAVVRAPLPTATGNLLTIDQQSQRVIIDWNKFNIASGSEVHFNQPSTAAAALNRIFSADPSIIQGKLTANGQIFLINQNGILFDRGAQVNVGALAVSTLNISNQAFQRGIAGGGTNSPAFEGGYDSTGATVPSTRSAGIQIGVYGNATDPAPTLNAAIGGSIVLVAPTINNQSGVITSPDGQVILAAGNKAYLYFGQNDPSSAGMRGMLVEISADSGPVDVTSLIRNSGTIGADRGNVTLAGLAINQSGRVSASTAALLNGSVWLQARTSNVTAGEAPRYGEIKLGAGSVTETPLDVTDKTTLTEDVSYASNRALIKLEGRNIVHSGTISAPGGVVDVTATDSVDPTGARIYLDRGSSISTAGARTDVPYESNLLTFRVTSNELKNSPLQKNGILRGASVTVDLRKGSDILDLGGYVAGQTRTVLQKATQGGDVSLRSAGSLIQRDGAVVDVSGGGYRYGGGISATTKLLGTDGKVYDIATAPKDREYVTILDRFEKRYTRWGQVDVYNNLLFGAAGTEAAYTEGKPGGNILINVGAGAVLDGTLKGGATVGANQLGKAPRGGALTIGLYSAADRTQAFGISNIAFRAGAGDTLGSDFSADTALSAGQVDHLSLSSMLFPALGYGPEQTILQNGFDRVELGANGRITVPAGVVLRAPIGSSLTFRAQQIEVAGGLFAPAGKISLQTLSTVGTSGVDANDPHIALKSGATLSATGLWLNNASRYGEPVGAPLPSAIANTTGSSSTSIRGGSVALASPSVLLAAGSLVDVGGGGSLSAANRLTAGDGGTITIAANPDIFADAKTRLDGDLRGFALGKGGSLGVTTGPVSIGAAPTGSTSNVFLPDFFTRSGFSSFDVTGIGGLTVVRDTAVRPQTESLVVDPLTASTLSTGGDIASIAERTLLPADQSRPVDLALRARGAVTGASAVLDLQEGASIVTDPGARITLEATGGMTVAGRVEAPAGNITLSLRSLSDQPASELVLGSNSQLLARGAFVARPNTLGLRQGSVLNGGNVTLDTANARVTAREGSTIDVGGASQVIDFQQVDAAAPVVARTITSDAGNVLVRAQDAVRLDGSIAAHAEGQSAGGSFALELTRRNDLVDRLARRIVVSQASGTGPIAADPGFVDARVGVDTFVRGGFDQFRLQSEDQIRFVGDVSMGLRRAVRLDTPLVDVAPGGRVQVDGNQVTLANSFGARTYSAIDSTLDNTAPSPIVPTRSGDGRFAVHARTVDLFGHLTINGVGRTQLTSDNDLRLTGRQVGSPSQTSETGATLTGSLTSAGDIALSAAQIYPTTRSNFTIAVAGQPGGVPLPGGTIRVAANGKAGGAVLSAGGRVTMSADSIFQDGVVKAPLGTIALNAVTSLELGPDSTTSVSAAGSVIPYGSTLDGLTWQYATTGLVTTPPDKRISLSGKKIDLRNGSTVDVSGGGDVLAVEFQPGSGGDVDTSLKADTYAILPAARLSAMPVDSDIAQLRDLGFGQDGSIYNGIHIGAGGLVPEGDYVLLPGRYALLPDAYLVQLQTGSTYANLLPGATSQLNSGATVVSGYRVAAGTGIRASQNIGVVVRPGTDVRSESDYLLNGAGFFAKAALSNHRATPRLPADGGRLAIAATDSLRLDGLLRTAPAPRAAGGDAPVAADVDLSAAFVAIVDRVGRTDIDPKYLQIDAGSLSRIDGSLLIGGTRSDTADGVQISAVAGDVLVANGNASPLEAPELILVARDSVTIANAAALSGRGSTVATARDIKADASGALVRLSNGAQVAIDRGATIGLSTGVVDIGTGATLRADGALLIDATQNLRSRGTLAVAPQGAVALASSRISLGETTGLPSLGTGLVLSNADLAGFNQLGELAIKSYSSIDLYGNAALGSAALVKLTLDSSALVGFGSATDTARIAAKQVVLTQSGSLAAAATTGPSRLAIDAGKIVLGAGDKAVTGFRTVALSASGDLTAAGTGSLRVAGDLAVQAARIASDSGGNQTWQAVDTRSAATPTWFNVDIAASPTTGALAPTALGSRLTIEGKRIASAGTIALPSGNITLAARGPGADDGVTLLAGARLEATGAARDFNGATALVSGGTINLIADRGAVAIGTGAVVTVAGAAEGGDAGTLNVRASSLAVDGSLGGAGAAGASGGRFVLDTSGLANFSTLNDRLNAGGFTAQRDLRVRTGDVRVAATDTVRARQVSLAADAGRIDVDGVIDAHAAEGKGAVVLAAQNGVRLAAGSRIDASGTSTASGADAPYANGGTVRVETRGGNLDFASGAVIDVRAGEKGAAGQVTLAAARTAANGVQADLQGTVLSQRHAGDAPGEVAVEGRRVETASGTLSAATVNGYAATNAAFVNAANVAAITGQIRGDDGLAQQNAHVRAALEVQSTGDLTLANAWNLTTGQWLARGEPGTLTVRARGNLTISSALGLPNDDLATGRSWNLRLVGGADLTAANPLAVRGLADLNGSGNVTLSGANARVRTGTGNIDIAAGNDFRITDARGVVYTSGIASVPDPTPNGTSARWATGGGKVSISAQHDAVGVGSQWITDWMRRTRGNSATLLTGDWWVHRPNFRQNVGSFAGGDIAVTAGNSVRNLSAMSATTGRTFLDAGGVRRLDVQGGGNLSVQAGNDVVGGDYLVARGVGNIRAGGSVGSATPTQLYLMGESNDPALKQANIRVEAGANIALQSINNPTVVALTNAAGSGTGPSFGIGFFASSFFTYADNSAVALRAKGGDISFARNLAPKSSVAAGDAAAINSYAGALSAYPATLDAVAFAGDITSPPRNAANFGPGSGVVAFPSPVGGLRLLAGGSVSKVDVDVSDLTPSAIPSWNSVRSGTLAGNTLLAPGVAHAVVHAAGRPYNFDVQSLGGSISDVSFTFPAAARLWAAQDIGNFSVILQNLDASDTSIVHANQRDVRPSQSGIEIRGPGRLVVQAGGTIDLGLSNRAGPSGDVIGGLVATGNGANANLAVSDSARITLIAGVAGEVDLTKLDAAYLELIEAGKAKDNARAQRALQAFLGTAEVKSGNIFSYNTSIQTFSGSGIDLLAPAGDIVVGLTTPNTTRTVGVITNGGGAIQSYLSGNFNINQGKVLTAQGGDIVIYTSTGNIDAGRGARTSRTTPAPQRLPVFDANQVLAGYRYVLPAGVAGSGIQTVTSDPDGPGVLTPPLAGNIFLFAPSGIVDAGEAGIVSGANIFIAAQQVLNAVNITSQGTSVGVPQVVAGSLAASVAASGAGNTTAGATKAAEDAARAASASPNLGETFKPSILTVEVLGFGDKKCKETQKDCFPK